MIKSKFIQSGKIRTHYLEDGIGKEMILLHGGRAGVPTSCHDWDLNISQLAKQFHVYALDQWGFGLTDKPPTNFSYEARINHVVQFMNEVGIREAHLVGHSLGGYVAAKMTIEYSKMVRSLVIVDSASVAPLGNVDDYGRLAPSIGRSQSFDPSKGKDFIREILSGGIYDKNRITEEMVDRWYKEYCEYPQLSKTAINQMENTEPLTDKLKEINRPTLIIWPKQSGGTFLFRGIKLAEIIPGSQIHILDKAAHFAFIDQPYAFNRLLIAFCGKRQIR